jgi:glutaredoxin 3
MPQVTIYTTRACPYCSRARRLLQRKGVEYEDIAVDEDPEQRRIMEERSQRDTVPQIFIGELHIGGYTDMVALDAGDELDDLLCQ